MFTIRGLVRTATILLTCLSCSACGANPASLLELVISPTPTHTPSPTITLTPTPTSTPEPTPTPLPQEMGIEAVLANCQALAESGNDIIVTGKIYLPQYAVYGYETAKGMLLTDDLPSNPISLIALIEVGAGANRMDALPQFFSERDLVIRSAQGQVIRYGHSVSLKGRMEFKPDSQNLRCALRVEEITSLMPAEVNTPLDVEIGSLLVNVTIGHGLLAYTTNPCAQLAFQNQQVIVKGSVIAPKAGITCDMGFCKAAIDDGSGQILLTIVQGYGANSVVAAPDSPALGGWKFYDKNLVEVDKEAIALTGVLFSDGEGCRIIVYEVGQQ